MTQILKQKSYSIFNKEQTSQSLGKLKNQQIEQHEDSQAQLSEEKSLRKNQATKFDFQFKTTKHGEILRINDFKIALCFATKDKTFASSG